MSRRHSTDASRSMDWSGGDSDIHISSSSRTGRKFFQAKTTQQEIRPLKKLIVHEKPREKTGGLRKFYDQYTKVSEERPLPFGNKRKVLGSDGVPMRYRQAEEFDFTQATGCRKKIELPEKIGPDIPAEYVLGYFNNSLHGGGFIPGSNFGFSAATATTGEAKTVFGKSLTELWNRSPRLPTVLIKCLEYLERPEILKYDCLFPSPEDRIKRDYLTTHRSKFSQSTWKTGKTNATKKSRVKDTAYANQIKQVKQLRAKFDKGLDKTVDLKTITDPKVVSTLLRMFFKELTPSLLTYELYVKIVNTQRRKTIDQRISALKPAIAALPAHNQQVLGTIVCYFNLLLLPENTKSNHLTSQQIAKTFAPLFLRQDPRKPRIEESGDIDLSTLAELAIGCMLDYSKEIFQPSLLQNNSINRKVSIPFEYKRVIKGLLEDEASVKDLSDWEGKMNEDEADVDSDAEEAKYLTNEEKMHDDDDDELALDTSRREEAEKEEELDAIIEMTKQFL